MGYLPAYEPTRKELSEILKRHYRVGELLKVRKLKKGLANSLYHLKTTQGDFAFKIVVRHNSDQVLYEINLLNKLRGLPTPRPIRTKTGGYVFEHEGHRMFMYEFLPGQERKNFTPRMLRAIGVFQGKLHIQTLGFDFPVRRVKYYEVSKKRFSQVWQKRKELKNQVLREALDYLRINLFRYPLSMKLPEGAMHIDIKPENTLFQNGRLTGVVDFDNSYNGPLIFDLADTLMWFCSKNGKFDINKAKVVLSGYISVRKLSSLEKQKMFNALHRVFLAISLCGIELSMRKTLPEKFIVEVVIQNLLKAEKNLVYSLKEFSRIAFT